VCHVLRTRSKYNNRAAVQVVPLLFL
jgi:hypothetical protein